MLPVAPAVTARAAGKLRVLSDVAPARNAGCAVAVRWVAAESNQPAHKCDGITFSASDPQEHGADDPATGLHPLDTTRRQASGLAVESR